MTNTVLFQIPWIESLLLFVGVTDVTTMDYTRKEYETSGLKWTHLNQYLREKMSKHGIYKMVSSFLNAPYTFDGEFDVVVSHLSIETIGLGRYGENLYPVSLGHTISRSVDVKVKVTTCHL